MRLKNKGIGLLIVLAIFGYKIYQNHVDKPAEHAAETVAVSGEIGEVGLPVMAGSHELIAHTAYALSYNEIHEQADWVAYSLSAADLADTEIKRKDNFRSDPEVDTESATLADYRRSGYDRGHLAPAADMKRSAEIMSESFFMSNMSPQKPAFNRGMWKELEASVRRWARRDGRLEVVTGPVLEPGLETIGANEVSVPRCYYKVLLDLEGPEFKGIGFLMPNRKLDGDILDYAVPIDSVEARTGIDFFAKLADDLEARLEAQSVKSSWQ